jgi:hypothetical protein
MYGTGPEIPMLHRHLESEELTLPAIDDIICRGGWADWRDLHEAALKDLSIVESIMQICLHFASMPYRETDPFIQHHLFWLYYAETFD